jgi:hypothetical protein
VWHFHGSAENVDSTKSGVEPLYGIGAPALSTPRAVEGTSLFEATGEGTRLSSTFQMEPGGLFKVAGPVFASQLKKQSEADLQRLKALLEAQA